MRSNLSSVGDAYFLTLHIPIGLTPQQKGAI